MKEKDNNQEEFNGDPFSRMMFGPARTRESSNNHRENENQEQDPSIDYEVLMEVVDTLIDSAARLKPVFYKFYPYIQKFMKKE